MITENSYGCNMNPYISDILSQPEALREAVTSFSIERLTPIVEPLHNGTFDRIIISGMGSSYNAAYPAYVRLSSLPVPVILVNSAELLHTLNASIGSRTLLWLNSQSGRSIELVNLIQYIEGRSPACLLACVNDLSSPMAQAADICTPIHAGDEATVSTKTYINMMAINLLAAEYFTGGNIDSLKVEMLSAADKMGNYLFDWQTQVNHLNDLLGELSSLLVLGRGTSLSAVWNGSLINKEAAKCAFEGMQAADFRHGPLELAIPGFAAMIFAGSPETKSLNHGLALEITEYGGRVFWVDHGPDSELPSILIPETSERTRPLVEILPLQMLTLVMAKRKGIQAGQFQHVGKVTTKE
jgi:glucosamine--fructose-6-phosphate aminotransferase (isomerizing)